MDEGEFNGRNLYTGLRLDYRLRLWALATSVSRAISTVAELLVLISSFRRRPLLVLVSVYSGLFFGRPIPAV